jgi:hypothetical protein
VVFCASATLGYAQQAQPRTSREDGLDPSPIDPSVDPNIDMFVNDWKNAAPRSMYGGVTFQDILTKLEGPDRCIHQKGGARQHHRHQPRGACAGRRQQPGRRRWRQVFFTGGPAPLR